MIAVRKYKAFWDYVATQLTSITRVILVDDETELSKKISDVANGDILLVAAYPSSDLSQFDEDNLGDVDTCVIYVLMKIDPRNVDDDDIMTERETTQNLMKAIRLLMLDMEVDWDNINDNTKMMKQLIRGKQHVDRERNYFGCNGYSLSFGLRTNGI